MTPRQRLHNAEEIKAVIACCTRDGRTLWAHVAQQLGISVDKARTRYGPDYNKEPACPASLAAE